MVNIKPRKFKIKLIITKCLKKVSRLYSGKYKALCLFLTITLLFSNKELRAQVLSITSFSPISAKPGDEVDLIGTNFNATAAKNIVFFGANKTTVTTASTTCFMVTVPTCEFYAPTTLLNTGTILIAFSLSNFTPAYSPTKTRITAGDFQAKQNYAMGSNSFSFAIRDLEGDGYSDLVVANGGSTPSLYFAIYLPTLSSTNYKNKLNFQ
jgi:hypothetical protein